MTTRPRTAGVFGLRGPAEIVEACLDAFVSGDLGAAPLAPEVLYEGPTLSRKLIGDEVREYISRDLPAIRDVRVRRHIVDTPYVATILEIETASGTISAFVLFRLASGLVQEIRAFYDTRPLPDLLVFARSS